MILNKKQGQLKKMLILIILVLFLIATIIAAQDIIQDSSITQETQIIETQENINLQSDDNIGASNAETEITESTTQEQINLCENIKCDDSTLSCPDEFIVSCENSCDSETGTCASCVPSCENHEQILEQNQTENEINKEIEEVENETAETINETIEEIVNETGTANQTENETNEIIKNETKEIANETIKEAENETNKSMMTGEEIIEISTQPNLDIQIFSPSKITRGEVIEVKAVIINSGEQVKKVAAKWVLPANFEIILGNQMENCGNLNKGESCISILNVKTSFLNSLGKNQIKIIASYE